MRRKQNRMQTLGPISLPVLLLGLFSAIGIACGYFFSALISAETTAQLRSFLSLYRSDLGGDPLPFFSLLFCYLRAPLLILLCCFSALGVVCLPMICAIESFLLSFSLCSFALSLGTEHLLLLVGMFLPRIVLYLPLVLLLSIYAWQKAYPWFSIGRGKRANVRYEADFWYRFCFAALLLCCGCVLEFYLLPRLLGAGVL